MNFKFLKVEKKEPLILVSIQRPEKLNALNCQIFDELDQLLDDLKKESFKNFRAIYLKGQGEKAFSVGADLKSISAMTNGDLKSLSHKAHRLNLKIESHPLPIIAGIQGFALGGGLELALACDLILATANARLGQPEVKVGLIPGFGGGIRLKERIGIQKAKLMIFSGQTIGAQEGLQMGLVNQTFDSIVEMETWAQQFAKDQKSSSANAVALAKKVFFQINQSQRENDIKTEQSIYIDSFEHPEGKEGVQAFLEKRRAHF